jgi:signal peptidase II
LSPASDAKARERRAPAERAAKAVWLHPAKLALTLLPAAAAAGLDLATKAWAVGRLSPYESLPVTGFLDLVLVANTGAAFSLLAADAPGQGQRMALLALLALLPLAWFYGRAAAGDRARLVGLGLVLGGAAGNVHDRLRYGAVVDFVDLHLRGAHWPAFNVADVSVCVGAGLLALTVFFGRRQGPGPGGRNP